MRLFIVTLALVLGLGSGSAFGAAGELTIGMLLEATKSSPELKATASKRLGGQADGMGWYLQQAKSSGAKPLFCTPPNLMVSDNVAYSIFKGYMERHPEFLEMPIDASGGLLLDALIDTFPCPK